VPDSLDLQELVRRWRVAEQQLYPTILADPSGYQRYVLAVRGLADELSVVASPEDLVDAYAASAPRAAAHLRAVGGPEDAGAAELVAGAAFALRERELAAALAAADRRRRLAEAAAAGSPWVVVREVGEAAMAVYGNYRRLEMHLPDGTGLFSYAEPQVDTAGPVFVIEQLALDPASGAATGDPGQRWTFTDPVAWRSALAQRRSDLGVRLDTPGAERED
jgi:hypothetical protein